MSVADDAEHGGGHADAGALQARVMELEIKASYTEDLLEQLNLTIYRQQQQIDRLLDELRDLRRRVPEGGPAGGATHLRDELPPHY
ncbi:SlyX family protein [Delftia acidovorans]|uniref:SlyX family protein n=1 Tax=Delftia acidovorans TaxID=80866 RepID=UPI00241E3855|nr:SlyX family protein [Delftia acidovorans]